MLQADCAPITTSHFDAPTISSELVSESINVPDSTVLEDPAVFAWRAWCEAQLAFEAGEATLDDVTPAETAVSIAHPMTLAGALAQLRCALTFIGGFDGWIRNLALDQVATDDASARAKDRPEVRMVASVIDFIAATLAAPSAERPCTKDRLSAEGEGGWNARYAEWEMRVALMKAEAACGSFYEANHTHERLSQRMLSKHGSIEQCRRDAVDGPNFDAAYKEMVAAEDLYAKDFIDAADCAAASLVSYPAPSREAVIIKMQVINEHDLHQGSKLSLPPMEIIFNDLSRLGLHK